MTHGTIAAYNNSGCRCDACRTVKVEYNRRSRLKHNPPKPKRQRLSRRDHARLYRAMLKAGQWEQGIHYRRVTTLAVKRG